MTEDEIKVLQEELASTKTAYEALQKEHEELKTKHTELETSNSEVNKKYVSLLEEHRSIITNGAPLPDSKDDPEKILTEMFKNL